MVKSEYDLLKNALNKKYIIIYDVERGAEKRVTGELLNYNGGNIVLLDVDRNELYHIPFSGIKWMLPMKGKSTKESKLGKNIM